MLPCLISPTLKRQEPKVCCLYVHFEIQYGHMIPRSVQLPEKQSFFLFGPRGSGKSTLLKNHFQDKKVLWINLLDSQIELKLQMNPTQLLERWAVDKPEWIVIDEIQKIPQLLDIVQIGIEEHRIKFALTGSSARKLKRGSANLLAGRAVERKLLPFSSEELGSQFQLNLALKQGLFPKIWDEELSETDASDYLYAYVNTYLKEEIAAEQLVRNLDPFRRFLVSAAQSNGKIINHSAIERDAGIPRKQSERHFEILVDTLIGFYLEPFNRSIRKRQTSKSKFYFCDTGLVRALQNLSGESLEPGNYEYGNLFETFLVNEFVKKISSYQKRWNLSYLRDNLDHEIDLIIEKPRGRLVLVEIKSFSHIKSDKLQDYIKLKNSIPCEAAYLLSNDRENQVIQGIRCMHWQDGLKEIFASE